MTKARSPVDPLVFCTCEWSTVNTATIDPPEMVKVNPNCPIHGEAIEGREMSEKHDAMWGGGTGSPGEYIAQQEAEIERLTQLNEKLGASFDLQIEHRIEQINRLESDNVRLRAALEEVRQPIYALMPDGWSDAPYVISVIDRALANVTKTYSRA